MPLESTMILLDCSQYMRNGDYIPTRLEAQRDAANVLVNACADSHPENTVGVSVGASVLVSPTTDMGKLLRNVHEADLKRGDTVDLVSAVAVASLALKHRPNKKGGQRIIVFCGTPVSEDSKALQKAGKLLKKNNIAIDIITLGGQTDTDKLQELVDAANGRSSEERTCHLVQVPVGVLPSDVLANSPLLARAGYGGGGDDGAVAADTNAFADFGGVDPNMDPELAMALRVSMEEERARQERAAEASAAAPPPVVDEEEALLQQALAMSMNENEPDVEMKTDDTDEAAALQQALAMSTETTTEIQDPAFVNQVLADLGPDVDPNDPEIQELLKKAAEKKKEEEGK